MMQPRRLVVVDSGLLATVQDLGRRGVGALGVSPSGAVDWYSARAANRLVGNPDGCPLIETTMNGAAFDATARMTIALTGADAPMWIGGKRRSSWCSHVIEAGDRLLIGPATAGLRSYIAVDGGFEVQHVLGSAATDVGGGFGGLKLRPGDPLRLAIDSPPEVMTVSEYDPGAIPAMRQPFVLRVLAGPDALRLGPAVVDELLAATFRGSARSSRQGLRLDGATIDGGASDAISAGVCAGCVQLPGDGSPIVLLAEHQTTGGYPVALCVITADIPLAAQVRPGDEVRFERVDRAGARAALATVGERLRAIRALASVRVDSGAGRLGRGFSEGASL
ncbi:MAG TPA: biotin-dependent carboxyltransferase family protein [Candidatus Eremiobacteraceae bacterium]|nr:biotin-dependent carboxyltransferase family protein [Candidatus Eremiobacteraceae bacterium]